MWKSWFDFIKFATTPATPAAVKATQNQAELWQIYLKGLQKLTQLWAESLQQSLESGTRAVGRAVSFSNFSCAKILNKNINIRLECQKFNSQ
jgi:hypothetical protein